MGLCLIRQADVGRERSRRSALTLVEGLCKTWRGGSRVAAPRGAEQRREIGSDSDGHDGFLGPRCVRDEQTPCQHERRTISFNSTSWECVTGFAINELRAKDHLQP